MSKGVEGTLTSVDDSLIVQILDCTRDGPDDVLGIPEYQPSPVIVKRCTHFS